MEVWIHKPSIHPFAVINEEQYGTISCRPFALETSHGIVFFIHNFIISDCALTRRDVLDMANSLNLKGRIIRFDYGYALLTDRPVSRSKYLRHVKDVCTLVPMTCDIHEHRILARCSFYSAGFCDTYGHVGLGESCYLIVRNCRKLLSSLPD